MVGEVDSALLTLAGTIRDVRSQQSEVERLPRADPDSGEGWYQQYIVSTPESDRTRMSDLLSVNMEEK